MKQYVLRATEKPKYAKRNSDNFYYRDRGRVDIEGIEKATKFTYFDEAKKIADKCNYEIEEI